MAEFDFREYARNRNSGGYPDYSYNPGAPFSWRDFANNYSRIADANRQMQQSSRKEDKEEPKKYRQMTGLERISNASRVASDYIASYFGNKLFGTPDNPYTGEKGEEGLFGKPELGEDINEFSLKNAPRFIANLPAMFVSSVPDTVAPITEFMAGTPAMEADYETGLIEDRKLTAEEKAADLGYAGLSLLGFAVGPEGKLAGGAAKGAAKLLGKAGKADSATTKALETMGNVQLRGNRTKNGFIETRDIIKGKTGSELNSSRLKDAAAITAFETVFEGAQEAGQTYLEDVRYGNVDENTPKRMLDSALWGGLAGGLVGGVQGFGGAAIANSRANRNLDKDGTPLPSLTPITNVTDDPKWYKLFDLDKLKEDEVDVSSFNITPEMQQMILEEEGDRKGLTKLGSSMKGVAGYKGQKANDIILGVKAIRAQYNRNIGNDEEIEELAGTFGLKKKDFITLMENNNDEAVASRLNAIAEEAYRKSPSNRIVFSSSRAPATKYGSHQTFFVRGVTSGNTVSFAAGVPAKAGGDLDGDNYSVFLDPTMKSWAYLPTRKLMTPKAIPAKGSKGMEYLAYGSPEFDFEMAGISDISTFEEDYINMIKQAIDDVLTEYVKATPRPGDNIRDRVNKMKSRIFESFSVSESEKKLGVSWKHKLAKALADIGAEENDYVYTGKDGKSYRRGAAGDDLAADIIHALSETCAPITTLKNCFPVEGTAYADLDEQIKASAVQLKESSGSMGDKVSLMQILGVFGKLNYELSKRESPMFRFKQMSAWNAKFRQMSEELTMGLGLNRTTDIDDKVKWCMQMINDLHLPIDYAETLFLAKVSSDVYTEFGINGTERTNKFGKGIEYEVFKERFAEIWNTNADIFDKAARDQLTSSKYNVDEMIFGSEKSKILEGNSGSFSRAFDEVFGGMSVPHIASIDSTDNSRFYNISGLIEHLECSPTDYYEGRFDYVGGGFSELIKDLRDGYQGKYAAITSTCNDQINSLKDMKAEFKKDEKGYITWDPEDDIEVGFWIGAVQNLFGLKAAKWLGILGTDWVSHSEWGKFLLPENKDPKVFKRAYIAGMTAYNWRDVIREMNAVPMNKTRIEAALSRVDFDNPWNRFILTEMMRYGERETGKTGSRSLTPLIALTDPTKGTYDQISAAFEQQEYLGVRKNSDMLFYFASQTNESSLTGSDLSTRARTAKNYISAIHNNSIAKAIKYVSDLEKLQKDSMRDDLVMLKALNSVITENPNIVESDMYATAIHDAGFASRRSSDKGKAGQAAGLHWGAATNYLGGYSAAFIEQLGFSVGMIDSDMAESVASAIRSAFIDKDFDYRVMISDDGTFIHINRDAIFKAAGVELMGQDPDWPQVLQLFYKAPQLLCQLMPQTYQQLSPDADTVTPVMIDTPANLVQKAIVEEGDPAAQIKRQQSKVKNHLLLDQNSTVLILGSLDSRYDSLIRSPSDWCDAVDTAAEDWASFIYKVVCVDNTETRNGILRRCFGTNRASVASRTKRSIEDLIQEFSMRQSKSIAKTQNKKMADRRATARFENSMENLYARYGLSFGDEAEESAAETPSHKAYRAEVSKRKDALHLSIALEQLYREDFLGEKFDVNNGAIDESTKNVHRSFLRKQVTKDGSRRFSDEEIENMIRSCEGDKIDKSFLVRAGNMIISKGILKISEPDLELRSLYRDEFVAHVENYYNGREYKRTQSDYMNLEDEGFEKAGLDEWEKKVDKAFYWKEAGERKGIAVDDEGWTLAERMEWLENQANFWNREMIAASLQKVYDTYGAETASDELIKMGEAEDFIREMVEEIRADKSVSKLDAVDPDSISMPDLSFKNPATSPHIRAASIDLESGGVTVLSGQNAGSYQYLTVLDFIQEDFSCPAGSRTGLSRDEVVALAEDQQGGRINYKNSDGSISSAKVTDILYKTDIWTDEVIARTEWYPMTDCLCGAACHNHNPGPVTAVSGDYIGGRYSLADLCWYLSERKVFKLKKKRNVFKKISHIISRADNIRNKKYSGEDVASRQSMLNKVYEYQEILAEHINDVFVSEKMDDEFGIDDARMLAAFMTPALEIRYKDVNGEMVTGTISKWSLASDTEFLTELNGIDPTSIVEFSPVTMSIFSVCKKMSHDVLALCDNDKKYKEGKTPDRKTMSEYVKKSLSTWRGKCGETEDLARFLKSSPVIKRAAKRSRIVGSSPNSMQNWLERIGSVQNSGSYSVESLFRRASQYDQASAELVERVNKNVKFSNATGINGSIFIVGSEYGSLSQADNTSYRSAAEAEKWKDLEQVKDNFSMPNSVNAVITPNLFERPAPNVIRKIWNKASENTRAIFVPSESESLFIDGLVNAGIPNDEITLSREGTVNVDGKEHAVFSPLAGRLLTPEASSIKTHFQIFDPFSEIFVSFQDYGELGSDDSGSLGAPRLVRLHMPFSDILTFNESVLFANAPTGSNLKGARFRTVDLDDSNSYTENETIRQSLLKEIRERLDPEVKEEYGPQRIILPKFGDTYDPANDDLYLKAVQAYLEKKPEELQPDGTVKGNVHRTECFNILCIEQNGEAYFFPLIFNSGKGTPVLDHVYLDPSTLLTGRDLSVSFRFSGSISFEEAEGIKMIFPTFAYKTYTRLATADEYARFARCGIDITLTNRRTGERRKLETDLMYSGKTEENRLVDAGYQAKLENLGNLQRIVPHNYFRDKFAKRDANGAFLKDAAGNYVIDEAQCTKVGVSPAIIMRMLDINDIGIWRDFAYNDVTIKIHEDPIVNEIMRKVVQAALSFDHPYPIFAFSNLINDEIVYADWNCNEIFGVLTDSELERFFYALDERFCFDGPEEQSNPDKYNRNGKLPWIDSDGRILSYDKDGNPVYRVGHIHFLRPTDDSSMLGQPSGKAKFGIQSILNEALIHGIQSDGDFNTLLEYMRARRGDGSNYVGLIAGKYDDPFWKSMTEKDLAQMAARSDYESNVDERMLKRSYRPYRKAKERWRKIAQQFSKLRRKEIEFKNADGKVVDLQSKSDADASEYQRVMRRWREFFDKEMEHPFTDLEIHNIFRDTTASTYNSGNGEHDITVDQFVTWMDKILDNLENKKFPFEKGLTVAGRPVLPYVTSETLDRLLSCDKFKSRPENKTWTREEFIAAMKENLEDTFNQLRYMKYSQREAVYTCIDYIGGTYGDYEVTRPIGEYGLHLSDILENNDPLYEVLRSTGLSNLDKKRQKTADLMKKIQERENRRGKDLIPTDSEVTGFMASVRAKGSPERWNAISAVSRAASCATALLGPSAVIGRYITQGQNRLYMAIHHNLTKGYISTNNPGIEVKNRQAVRAISRDRNIQAIWKAMNILTLTGEDIITLQKLDSAEKMIEYLEDRLKNMSWVEKIQHKAFSWASGGRIGVDRQIENFVDRFGMTLDPVEDPELCEVVGPNGETAYEMMLVQSPENFMIDFLTTRDNNGYFIKASQARNWVVNREHNGQSIAGLILTDMFEQHPMAKMFMITGLCKFPHYAYEVGGWFLNHFAPISSVVYLLRQSAIDFAAKGDTPFAEYLDSLGIERTQIYQNLKEALINDSLMMGSTALAALLYSIGAIEPPDDDNYEEYAGNPGEWTICGFRLSENWWLMDILGPFGAMACTWKSVMIGKPRYDLLTNWLSQSLWSNPIVKTSDIVRSFFDPTESYLAEYENISEQFEDVEGGSPGFLEFAAGGSLTLGLNWIQNAFTPSIIKEISRSKEFLGYERSYKKKKNAEGKEVKVGWLESEVRKITRNNLALGLLIDAITALGGRDSSGFVATEMPYVKIPDRNQLDSLNYFKLTNEDGTEKTEAEKQAIAYEVISILYSTDDIKGLVADGFVLPMETRIYASQMLNDMKQAEIDEYNDWVQKTGRNAYVVGEGDYTTGTIKISQIIEAYYDDLDQIDRVFDKLWSEEISRGLQMYYRLPTTYATTTSGEVYATGYAPSLFNSLPVPWPWISANGTDNAWFGVGTRDEGTMGKAGNWETESEVVPGASAGSRNLVPILQDRTTRPKLSDFGDDDNGGYSDTASGKQLAASKASGGAKYAGTTTTSYPSGGSRSGGSGGGGGGRSYTPNFYAPSVSLPRTNSSRIMNTDRAIKPNYDYLRPDFETKGSREAYRRSDI